MRVFRVPEFLGVALMLGSARHAAAVRVAEPLMSGLSFDIAHMLAGSLVLVSFMLLYQDRLYALLNVFALHARGAGARPSPGRPTSRMRRISTSPR